MDIRITQNRLVAILLSLSVAGYPATAMLARLIGAADGSLTPMFRAGVVALSGLAIAIAFTTGRTSRAASFLLLFMMIYLTRLLWDIAEYPSSISWPLTFFILTCLIPVFAISLSARKGFDEVTLLKIMLALGATVVGIYYLVLGPSYENSFHGRAGIETLNPVSLGQAAVSFAICGLVMSLYASSRRYVLAGVTIVIASIPLIVLAGSKGPIICFAAALLWLTRFNLRGIAAAVALSIGVYFASESNQVLIARFNGMLSGSDLSTEGRVTAQAEALDLFLSAPLFGAGATLPDGSYPHNLFIETAMATGLVGLFALTAAIILALRKLSKDRALSSALLIQYFLAVQFSGGIWSTGYFYCLLAYTLAVGDSRAKSSRTRSKAMCGSGILSEVGLNSGDPMVQ